jgi:tetratricopeptide (TPR) repeat protein
VVYPRNSPIRYELIKIEIDTGNYDAAVEVASEGYRLNERDAGCLVGRAEARLRRGRAEDEADVLKDLEQAEKIHRRDANLYRLRGELWLRRANRTEDPGDRERMLKEALTAYDAGIANIRAGWLQASLLSSKSRVLLLLQDYDGAAAAAKAAVETAPGHVGNHIALALARLAAAKWQPAVLAADAGQNVGGWAGRIILAAVRIIGLAMAGVEPQDLSPNCKVLADEFEHSVGKFTPQETWTVVREAVSKKVAALGGSGAQLITDTIRLLEGQTSASEFRGKWAA